MVVFSCVQIKGNEFEHNLENLWNFTEIPAFTGIVIFSFECVGCQILILNCLFK